MRHSQSFRVTRTYALAATGWIVASDLVMAWYEGGFDFAPPSILKGLLFVAVTAAALYVALARHERRRDAAESAHAASERRLREAQRVAHVGNWETDFTTGAMMWSDEIYRILELDPAKPRRTRR